MIPDIDLFGVYLPGLMVLAAIAFLLCQIVHRLLARADFYRMVWHPALFDTCLFILILAGLTTLHLKVTP